MKGYRFVEEYEDTTKKTSCGTIMAIQVGQGHIVNHTLWVQDVIAGSFYTPNSNVSSCTADAGYIRRYCKRISEARARVIHPRLFAYLDQRGD